MPSEQAMKKWLSPDQVERELAEEKARHENATQSHQDALQEPSDDDWQHRACENIQAIIEGFHIDSEEKANWYLRKLANIDAEVSRITSQCAQMVNDLQSDRERLVNRHQADLEHWAKENLPKGKRNIKLLQGTVSFRMVPHHIRVSETGAAFAFVCDTGLPLTKTVFDQSAYKQYAESVLKASGELLPGIEVVAEHESISITFGKKE